MDYNDIFLHHMEFDPDTRYDWFVEYRNDSTKKTIRVEYRHNLLESEINGIKEITVFGLSEELKCDVLVNGYFRASKTEYLFEGFQSALGLNLNDYKTIVVKVINDDYIVSGETR